MNKVLILSLLVGYFLVLILVSYLTSKKSDNETFFTGNRNSKWYIVAFGMIGASLSGVTFISIPGTIQESGFTYLQIALGYILGYAIISFVLLPLYYRLNLTSIYSFLGDRFGPITYKLGAGFFILSRLIGAALRMYLVANVLQTFVFDKLGVPFEITVAISIALIWVYTYRGGIKTIIWTDTLQTLFMLISVGLSIYFISDNLNISLSNIYSEIDAAGMGDMWQTDNSNAGNYWWKGLLGGMFITLGMTGVDQDMMQKNLSCKNLGEAKLNMMSMSVVLFFVNVLFVALGGLLYLYVASNPDLAAAWANHGSDGDLLFATVALESDIGLMVGVFFLLGLIAAAYSSADSALTALTTSVSVDFLEIDKKEKAQQEKIRKMVHIGMSIVLLLTIVIFKWIKSDNVVWELFKAANYTYGPLLGLFLFGVLSKRKVKDYTCLPVCIIVPTVFFIVNKWYSAEVFGDYAFGSVMLGINAAFVYIFLLIFSKSAVSN